MSLNVPIREFFQAVSRYRVEGRFVRRCFPACRRGVTVRGYAAVAVIAAEELERLLPPTDDAMPFVAFMESLSADGLDLTRDRDTVRDAAL